MPGDEAHDPVRASFEPWTKRGRERVDEHRRDAMPETRIGRLRPVVKEARGHEFHIRATCEEDLRRALGMPLVPTLGREVPPGLHDAIDGAHPIKNRTIAR